MIKKFAVALVLAVTVAAIVGCGSGDGLPKDAVAKVGETVITKAALDTRVAELQAQLPGQIPDPEVDPEGFKEFQAQVVDFLVTLEIAAQKAEELGVTVTDEDVQTQLDQISAMFGGDDAAFQEALKQQNMTIDQLKASLRERELLNKTAEAVTKDVTVPEAEIASYYEEHKDEFAEPETRTTRHILISPGDPADTETEPTDAEWEAARVEAEAVRGRIANGEDFATVAREVSDDPGSKDQGGDLGEVAKGVMVPAFEEAVFSLKVGELSLPIKTQFGYHLIEVEQVNEARQSALEEVSAQIDATLLDEAKRTVWEDWLAEAKVQLVTVVGEEYQMTTTTLPAAEESTTTTAQ